MVAVVCIISLRCIKAWYLCGLQQLLSIIVNFRSISEIIIFVV